MWLKRAVVDFLIDLKAFLLGKGGPDLNSDLDISAQEALGGCYRVFTFTRHGGEERILLKIPSGVRPGTLLRIAGKGLVARNGRTGDLYIRLHIQ